jgi:endonuclease/exonuclease/phosphatase family metal-dependent hydrolase
MFLKAIFDFIRKFFFLINILFALYSLLVYQLVFSANIQHWLAGFLTLSFPLVLLGNLFFVVVWTLGKSTKAFLSLIMIFMTYSIKDRTIKLGLKDEVSGYPDFSILTYNVMYVDHMNSEKPTASGTAMKGISETMETLSADIKCFQEFYNDTKVFELNMIKRLSKDNPFYVYMHSDKDNDQADGAIGLATFSKYPIIRKEEEYFKTNNNGLLSTDIVVKGDTIRVINVQLRSMGIRVNKMLDENKKLDKKETRTVLSQLKYGFKSRGLEVGLLESWIEKSPYPVLVVGDLNEIPYGYAYGKIRKLLNNSFEDAGQGFGFTYRKILGFLRIDNQFYNKEGLKVIKFKTLREYPFSDHYPLYGEYELQSKIGF